MEIVGVGVIRGKGERGEEERERRGKEIISCRGRG